MADIKFGINVVTKTLGAESVSSLTERVKKLKDESNKVDGSALGSIGRGAIVAGQGVTNLTTKFIGLVAAVKSASAISGFIQKGFDLNSAKEDSTVGIAAIVSSFSTFTDSQGRVLEGTEKLNAALAISREQLQKLAIDGLKTAATNEQLTGAFQGALASGLGAGLNEDEIRKVTVLITQAASALGVPLQQLNQEVRSILDGNITSDSSVAKAVNLTNEQVKQAKETGKLADLLTGTFKEFGVAADEASKNFSAVKSNAEDALGLFAGSVTTGLFSNIKDGLKEVTSLFDAETGTVSEKYRDLADVLTDLFSSVGSAVSDGIATALELAAEFGTFLKQNEGTFSNIADGFKTAATSIVDAVSELKTAGPILTFILEKVAVSFSFLAGLLKDIFVALKASVKFIAGDVAGARQTLDAQGGSQALANVRRSVFRPIEAAPGGKGTGKETEEKKEAPTKTNKIASGGGSTKKPSGRSQADKALRDAEREAEKLIAAQEKLDQALADATLRSEKSAIEQKRTLIQAGFDQRIIDAKTFYLAQQELDNQELDAQRNNLLEKYNAIANDIANKTTLQPSDRTRLTADLVGIAAQLEELDEKRKDLDTQTTIKINVEAENAAKTIEDLQIELDELKGNTLDAALAKIAKDARERLKQNTGNVQAQELIKQSEAIQTQKELFLDQLRLIDDVKEQNSLNLAQLSRDLEDGKLTQAEYNQALRAENALTSESLQGLIGKADELAETIGDKSLKKQVRGLKEEVKDLRAPVDELAKTVSDTLGNSITSGFSNILKGTESFGQALKNILLSLLQSINQLLAKQLAETLSKNLLGALSGGGGGGGDFIGTLFSLGKTLFLADGGPVSGPGGPRGDKIPAMLSDGEFVINAAAAARLGTPFLTALNGGRAKFANGGPVAAPAATAAQAVTNIVNVLDPTLVSDYLASSGGERLILNAIKNNSRAIKALGV